MNSKGKVLVIALGALALFVGGVAVATAAGPMEAPEVNTASAEVSISIPELEILCTGPPGSCGGG